MRTIGRRSVAALAVIAIVIVLVASYVYPIAPTKALTPAERILLTPTDFNDREWQTAGNNGYTDMSGTNVASCILQNMTLLVTIEVNVYDNETALQSARNFAFNKLFDGNNTIVVGDGGLFIKGWENGICGIYYTTGTTSVLMQYWSGTTRNLYGAPWNDSELYPAALAIAELQCQKVGRILPG